MNISTVIDNFLTSQNVVLFGQHLRTHEGEFDALSLEKALSAWVEMGKPLGATTIELDSPTCLTRLWGEKMGDELELEHEAYFIKSRGEGRAPEKLISRGSPMRNTNLLTLIILEHEGDICLVTAYAGPEMPPVNQDPNGEWSRNFLAYSPSELGGL